MNSDEVSYEVDVSDAEKSELVLAQAEKGEELDRAGVAEVLLCLNEPKDDVVPVRLALAVLNTDAPK